MPLNEQGIIITGAANPANEGLTVREALTRAIVEVYRQISRINNVYFAAEDSAYARLTESADVVTSFSALSELFAEMAERYSGNTLAATLADCGVSLDMSNLDSVLGRVFGPDAGAAGRNVRNVSAIWAAIEDSFGPALVADLRARFTTVAEAVMAAATTTSPVAGI